MSNRFDLDKKEVIEILDSTKQEKFADILRLLSANVDDDDDDSYRMAEPKRRKVGRPKKQKVGRPKKQKVLSTKERLKKLYWYRRNRKLCTLCGKKATLNSHGNISAYCKRHLKEQRERKLTYRR